ncbi:MAG TPA: hypothetical protein VM573_06965 [Actinomycetota bacterium]|nr:hypothetical protein [Actinomycetota bacterium]
MTGASPLLLAHGVGTVYESPIPVSYYLAGAAATVAFSFLLRALGPREPRPFRMRPIAGKRAVDVGAAILKWGAFAALVLTVVSGVAVRGEGSSLAVLLFWVAFVVGFTLLSSIVGGVWRAADPWATAEELYRLEDAETRDDRPPAWLGPLSLYLLFWFELVSGVAFEDAWVVLAILLYSLYSLVARGRFGEAYRDADPFAILFGFASRIAPLRLERDRVVAGSPVAALDEPAPMPLTLYASVFVLLGSTTLDNLRETVGWSTAMRTLGLDAIPPMLVDSVALAAFGAAFYATFLMAMAVARGGASLDEAARRFGWSLIPIAIAYVLAHNAPLLMTGLPALVRALGDPLGLGWDLGGLSGAFSGFIASPRAVWFIEIALIVGGHILGVLAAHRTALRLHPDHGIAVRSQYALTALMTAYTIATLWLLAQPLVA